MGKAGSPVGREPHGDGAPVVVRGRESRPHGEGGQATRMAQGREVREMRNADTILAIIREDPSHWRAGCGQSRTSGSEGGRRKRTDLTGTSPAVTPVNMKG